jgi:hypothetical protein
MRLVALAYAAVYIAIVIVFAACAIALVGFAGYELWQAIAPATSGGVRERFDSVLEAIGLATIAVASLELSQTVLEEEVQRRAAMSAPTRVRRFLSRFLIVVVVALAIECLVGVFRLIHHDPSQLPAAAAVGIAAAFLLAAWGLFIRWNVAAERLEPEAMDRAKREDEHVDTT